MRGIRERRAPPHGLERADTHREMDLEDHRSDWKSGQLVFAAARFSRRVASDHVRKHPSFSLQEQTDCTWGDWSEWGGCTVTCGTGQSLRKRGVAVSAKYGGKACDEATDSTELRSCNPADCPLPEDLRGI